MTWLSSAFSKLLMKAEQSEHAVIVQVCLAKAAAAVPSVSEQDGGIPRAERPLITTNGMKAGEGEKKPEGPCAGLMNCRVRDPVHHWR